MHDSSAIAYLIDPSLFQVKQLADLRGDAGHQPGQDVAGQWRTPDPPWEGAIPVNVCVKVDAAKMLELELDRLIPQRLNANGAAHVYAEGEAYISRRKLHDVKYGGQRARRNKYTPANHNMIFLFTGDRGKGTWLL